VLKRKLGGPENSECEPRDKKRGTAGFIVSLGGGCVGGGGGGGRGGIWLGGCVWGGGGGE